uniref:Uncharacterized protein n=1 Tax=Pseudomonas phage Cygsa01 TaxID=3138529 RepID=A0AAU6W3H1_9VIRU
MSLLVDFFCDTLEAIVDLWPTSGKASTKKPSGPAIDTGYLAMKQKDGGISGYAQAKDFIRWVQNEAHNCNAVVIAYESKWKWFANAEWREMVKGRVLDTGLFYKVEFSGPCQMDSEWSFGAYLKDGPTVKHATLDMRM